MTIGPRVSMRTEQEEHLDHAKGQHDKARR
jgi:hypothetical protein